MKNKIIRIIIIIGGALLLLLGVFIIGFVGTNLVMNLVTRHGNEVRVPEITGLHFDVARKQCKKLNLYIEETDRQYNNDFKKNTIITQKPEAGANSKIGRVIEVVVSEGPELVSVPSLVNMTRKEARLTLNNMGLAVNKKIQTRYSEDVDNGKIIFTQPSSESMVPKGAEVTLFISLGKLPDSSPRKRIHEELLDNVGD